MVHDNFFTFLWAALLNNSWNQVQTKPTFWWKKFFNLFFTNLDLMQ